MKKIFLNSFLVILFTFSFSNAYNQCFSKNTSFYTGEKIVYDVAYNWKFVWVSAGEVFFTVKNSNYKGKPVYYFKSYGTSYKSYDWVFKVRDSFEAFADSITLQPYWANRTSYEGGYEVWEDYNFNYKDKKLYSTTRTTEQPLRRDTLSLNYCVNDLITAIYYARCVDFSKYKVNDKIPIWSLIVGKVYPLYIRYLGKEVLTTRDKKRYNCIKFSAKLVEGTVFKGGEDLFVWVTDDENHLAIQVEAKILVGSIKAYIKSAENLRNPNAALIK